MVLDEYISGDSPEFEKQNAIECMMLCKGSLDLIKTRVTKWKLSLNHYLNDIKNITKDYTHYRDVAVRFGADVSGLPRRLNLGFTKK
ncbi:MAG: hypothetical protein KKF67_01490 [Nanoarchaeota archaeon]|nr:hypothetical protein [Nanoarchaeota archaeon]